MTIIDRVKYDASSDDVLVWKFPSEELRIGTQLIVNESQEALLFKGGQALDLFGPGRHTLSTDNIPLIRQLVNLPFGGKTPFTAEVWYINKTVKRDLKWGTRSPIPLLDEKLGYSINVRAYGRWGIRVQDSRSFITQIVGSQIGANSEKIEEYFMGEIVQKLSDALSKFFVDHGISILQANAKLNELSQFTAGEIKTEFDRFGIEIVNFNVERINIPDVDMREIQAAQKERMRMKQMQDVDVSNAYTSMRTFDTLEKAAENEGAAGGMLAGGLGLGMGLGAGVPLGQQVGQAMNANPQQPNQDQSSVNQNDPMIKIQKLKQLLEGGLISQEEFDLKKKEILDSI